MQLDLLDSWELVLRGLRLVNQEDPHWLIGLWERASGSSVVSAGRAKPFSLVTPDTGIGRATSP